MATGASGAIDCQPLFYVKLQMKSSIFFILKGCQLNMLTAGKKRFSGHLTSSFPVEIRRPFTREKSVAPSPVKRSRIFSPIR
jgi:hypothetical protein